MSIWDESKVGQREANQVEAGAITPTALGAASSCSLGKDAYLSSKACSVLSCSVWWRKGLSVLGVEVVEGLLLGDRTAVTGTGLYSVTFFSVFDSGIQVLLKELCSWCPKG